jgi:hypothetical protein
MYGCVTKGMLSTSGVYREKRSLVSKTLPFLLGFRTGNSHRREIWLSLESLVLLFMDKAIETIRAICNKKQSCY